MTTLRDLEVSPILNKYFNGVIGNCVKDIIGVQFRNVVTVGASVFSKYGFCAKPSRTPFAVEREGDASCVLVTRCPVCQPPFVLPPSFDSDLVELLSTSRSSHYDLSFSVTPNPHSFFD